MRNQDDIVGRAIALMLDGKTREAIRLLAPNESFEHLHGSRKMALGCGFAILNEEPKATAILSEDPEQLDKTAKAIQATGLAYQCSHSGDHHRAKGLLQQARQFDPDLALSCLSLGFYFARQEKDYEMAEMLLKEAKGLAPSSPLVHLSLLGVAADKGDISKAKALRASLPSHRYGKAFDFLLSSVLQLASTPLGGGIVALLIGLLTFVRYAGPVICLVWIVYSIFTFRRIKRISARLAVLPAIFSVVVIGLFTIRIIYMGRIVP